VLTYQEAEDSGDPEIMRQYWLEQQQMLQQQDRYWEPLDRAWAHWFQHEKTEQDLLDDPNLKFKPSARKMHQLNTKLVYNAVVKQAKGE
jgi:hypothetical protein